MALGFGNNINGSGVDEDALRDALDPIIGSEHVRLRVIGVSNVNFGENEDGALWPFNDELD